MMSKKRAAHMSATLIHHGHIRLLEKASAGAAVVGLTTDEEIRRKRLHQNWLLSIEKRF